MNSDQISSQRRLKSGWEDLNVLSFQILLRSTWYSLQRRSCQVHCSLFLQSCRLQSTVQRKKKTREMLKKGQNEGSADGEDWTGASDRDGRAAGGGEGVGGQCGMKGRFQTRDGSSCWLKWVQAAAHVSRITTVAAADQAGDVSASVPTWKHKDGKWSSLWRLSTDSVYIRFYAHFSLFRANQVVKKWEKTNSNLQSFSF